MPTIEIEAPIGDRGAETDMTNTPTAGRQATEIEEADRDIEETPIVDRKGTIALTIDGQATRIAGGIDQDGDLEDSGR